MNCPKCGKNTLCGDNYNFTTDIIKCVNCGLYHVVGSQKESLKRQISGRDPRTTEARRVNLYENRN